MSYQPKGSMCAACIRALTRNCSGLDFSTMPVIKTYPDGVKAVKCSDFKQSSKPV